MLERRQIEILMNFLSHSKAVKGHEIADRYHVTSRTVRNDIQAINEYLDEFDVRISADKKAGYFLSEENSLKLRREKVIEKISEGMDFELPQTSNERVVYLMYSMLFGNEYSSTDIEDLFYISPSAVYGNLKALENLLNKKTFLKLRKENNVYSISGTESDCRSVISGVYTQRRNVMLEIKYSRFITGDESFWNVIDFLSSVIMEYSAECGFDLIGDSVYGFAVDIALSYQRNKQGFRIEPQEGELNEYGLKLKKMLCEKDRIFELLEEDDYIYLQNRLAAKEYLNHPVLHISRETEECYQEYALLLKKFGIALKKETMMKLEMERIVFRQRRHYYFEVHRKHEIFDHDPDCYYLAQILKYYMEKKFPDIRLTKSDTAVLSVSLKGALIRPAMKAVIVTDASPWVAEEIRDKITGAFMQEIAVQDTMSHYAFERIHPSCECVISTEPLYRPDVPVIIIGRTVTEQTIETIRRRIQVDHKEVIAYSSMERSVSFEAAVLDQIRKLYVNQEIGSLDFEYIEKNLYQSFICFPKGNELVITFPLISANHLKEYAFSVKEPFAYDGREYTEFSLIVFPLNEINRINLHLLSVS